jgi:hypothetical protein
MRISRIKTGPDDPCHICHNRAIIEVTFGEKRPALRLCARDTKYLADFLNRRLEEHLAGKPIPVPRAGADDNWGNR